MSGFMRARRCAVPRQPDRDAEPETRYSLPALYRGPVAPRPLCRASEGGRGIALVKTGCSNGMKFDSEMGFLVWETLDAACVVDLARGARSARAQCAP